LKRLLKTNRTISKSKWWSWVIQFSKSKKNTNLITCTTGFSVGAASNLRKLL